MNRKKLIYIIIGALVLLFIVILLVSLFSGGDGEGLVIDDDAFGSPEEFLEEGESDILIGGSRLTRITSRTIAGYAKVGQNLVTVDTDGTTRRILPDGGIDNEIISLEIDTVAAARVSPKEDRFAYLLTESGDQPIRWAVLSKNDGRLRAQRASVKDIDFASDGTMYLVEETDSGSALKTIDGSNESTLWSTKAQDLVIIDTTDSEIIVGTRSSGFATGIVYSIDRESGAPNRVLGGINGLTATMSASADNVVYSHTSNSARSLGLSYLIRSSGNSGQLTINTIPQKCTFSQDKRYVFCATFEKSTSRADMPDDYFMGVFGNTTSDVVRINLETLAVEVMASNLPVDAINLELSPKEDWLYFVNKNDGYLYRLSLE